MKRSRRAPVAFPGGRRVTRKVLDGKSVAIAWAVPFDKTATAPVPFLIDIEDEGRVEGLHLYESADGYAQAWFRGVPVALHRLIARAPKGVLVDHRNRDRRDNRRLNLRRATRSLNAANRARTRGPHSSVYRGVTWHRGVNKWQAALKHGDRCYYLGLFESEEAAAEAYNLKAVAVWGEFANTNALPRKRRERRRAA